MQVNDGQESSALSVLPDPGNAGDDLVTITVVANSPPDADAGTDQTKNEGVVVQLDGSGTTDPDGDTLSYQWVQTGGPAVGLSDPSIGNPTFTAPAVTPGGATFTFTLTVTDDDPYNPKLDTDEVVITVVNINDPPNCSLAIPSLTQLWPPNHKMRQVTINGVMDAEDAYPAFTIAVTGVTQDEPLNGTGDGDTSPDATLQTGAVMGGMADAVLLRAERSGNEDGRVYVISFTADDGFESCTGSVAVGVPHDRKDTAIDSGQAFNSLLP